MRKILIVLVTAGVTAALIWGAWAWLQPGPATRVSGDMWDYALDVEDLPEGWTFGGRSVQLPQNLANDPAFAETTVLRNVEQIYSAQYTPPDLSELADFTLELLRYAIPEDAHAGLITENPGADWERLDAPAIGEESVVWRYLNPDIDVDQQLIRVDFRYLNVIGSVTLFGTRAALPDATLPREYAQKVLERLQAAPTPAALRELERRQMSDLRLRLLQTELPQLDADRGALWEINPDFLGGWTDNSDFSADAQRVLNQLGRITGYQVYYSKPVADASQNPAAGYVLFQQVSVYATTEAAPRGLAAMIGVEGAPELTDPPRVGEGVRAWSTLLTRRATADTIALTEISFHQGPYVATVQLQSTPLPAGPDHEAMLAANRALAVTLAEALAAKLQAGQP